MGHPHSLLYRLSLRGFVRGKFWIRKFWIPDTDGRLDLPIVRPVARAACHETSRCLSFRAQPYPTLTMPRPSSSR